jgi:hypothetical protein
MALAKAQESITLRITLFPHRFQGGIPILYRSRENGARPPCWIRRQGAHRRTAAATWPSASMLAEMVLIGPPLPVFPPTSHDSSPRNIRTHTRPLVMQRT